MKKQLLLGSLLALAGIVNGQTPTNTFPTTGNTGIGTTSPAWKLDITTGTTDDALRFTQTGYGSSRIILKNTTTGGREWSINSLGNGNAHGAGHFAIYDLTNTTNRFFISGSTGNIGIGTTSPAQKLDVSGNINTNGILTVGTGFIIDGTANTFKNTAWAGTGNRLILSDATGKITPLPQGGSTQVLYGTGVWGNLPAAAFTNSGSDLNLPTGKLGIGTTPGAPLDVNGDANVRGNVRSTNLAGTGERIVVADANGNLKPIGGTGNGGACSYATPWYLGGNSLLGTSVPFNTIGTCNNVPFILKAFDMQSIFIQTNSFVGIGLNNANPTAALDVSDGSVSNSYHTRIFGNANGDIMSNTHLKLSYGTGKVFEITEGGGPNRMYINTAGNVAFGDNSTGALNNAKLNVNVTSSNALAFSLVNNTTISQDFFNVYSNGYTEIKVYSPTNMPSNRVFAIKDLASPKDLFVVKSDGKVYSREVEISLVQNFPDYVFSDEYKLKSIKEVSEFITLNKHLPGFEKGEYYEKNGINVNDMFIKQQEKMEEMMLYIIELEKRLKAVEKK